METLSTFFEMGGYGTYIWPCYGLSAALMLIAFFASVRALKANRSILAELEGSSTDN